MTDHQTEIAVARVIVSQNEADHGPDHPEAPLNARFKLGVALRSADDLSSQEISLRSCCRINSVSLEQITNQPSQPSTTSEGSSLPSAI